MSKKMKKVLAASLGLITPAAFAQACAARNMVSQEINSSNAIPNSSGKNKNDNPQKNKKAIDTKQQIAAGLVGAEIVSEVLSSDDTSYIESSSERINNLCARNQNLANSLTTDIFDKKGNLTGKITLEPICQKHKYAYTNVIFDIKDPTKPENKQHNNYYKYFTSEDEITEDKGERYFEKHIERICNNDRKMQNIFFTIRYSSYNAKNKTFDGSQYVGCIGISRHPTHKPDLEVVLSRFYSGKRIATNALGCMINFLNLYNFECLDDEVKTIEAIIAKENYGSAKMAENNGFVNLGEVADLNESNGHPAYRWRFELNTNPVLQRARQDKNQNLILPYENRFPESNMVCVDEFFNHPRYFSRCKNDYNKIKKEIIDELNKINPGNVNSLIKSFSSWPIAWVSKDGKHMKIALNVDKLRDEISSIKEENERSKNTKYYIECPDIPLVSAN